MSFLVRIGGGGTMALQVTGGSHTLPAGGSQTLPVGRSQPVPHNVAVAGGNQNLPVFGSVSTSSASVTLPIMGGSHPATGLGGSHPSSVARGRGGYPRRTLESDLESMGSAGFEAAFAAAFKKAAARPAEMMCGASPGASVTVVPRQAPAAVPVEGKSVGASIQVAAWHPPGGAPSEGQSIGAPEGIRSAPGSHDFRHRIAGPMSDGRRTATPMAVPAERAARTQQQVALALQAPKVKQRKTSQAGRETIAVTSRRTATPTPVVMRHSVGDRMVLNIAALTEQGGGGSGDGLTFRAAAQDRSSASQPPLASMRRRSSVSPGPQASVLCSPPLVTRSPAPSTRSTRTAADQIAQQIQMSRAFPSDEVELQTPIESQTPWSRTPAAVTRSPPPSTRTTRSPADQIQIAMHSQVNRSPPPVTRDSSNRSPPSVTRDLSNRSPPQVTRSPAPSTRTSRAEHAAPQTQMAAESDNKQEHQQSFTPPADSPAPQAQAVSAQTDQMIPRTPVLQARASPPPARSDQPYDVALVDFLASVLTSPQKPTPQETPRQTPRQTLRSHTPRQTPKITPRLGTRETSRKTLPREASSNAIIQTLMAVQRRASSRSASAADRSCPPPLPIASSSPGPSERRVHKRQESSQSTQCGTPTLGGEVVAPSRASEIVELVAPLQALQQLAPPPAAASSFPASELGPAVAPTATASFPFSDREMRKKLMRMESPAVRSSPSPASRIMLQDPRAGSCEPSPASRSLPQQVLQSGDEKVVPPKVMQPSARRNNTERRYSEGDASTRAASRNHQVVVTTSFSPDALDGLESVIRSGDVLCVNGSRGINAMARLGANGGFMGHVLLAAGNPQSIMKNSPQAGQYQAAWPDGDVLKIWLVPTVESTRIEEGLHETIHILYVEPGSGFIRLGGEERSDMIVRYQDSATSSVEVWQSPPALRSQLRQDLFTEALVDLRAKQGSWSWSTAVRAFLMSAEVSEHTDPQMTMEQIQKAWSAEPICTSVIVSCWQRYLCKLGEASASFVSAGALPGTDALDLILMWMPLRADRTLPGELMKLMKSKGWTTVSQAPQAPKTFHSAVPETEGSFVRTNSF